MKRLLLKSFIVIVLMGAYNQNVIAQVHLTIDSLINFPDTALVGQAYPVAIRVKNIGNTPYQGPLQIGLMRDSLFKYLYFNSNPSVVLLPNDTLTLYTTNTGIFGFVFDSTVFRAGNNVVVVWPYSNQSIMFDSLTTQVYVDFTTGVRDLPYDNNFMLYPNPFTDELRISMVDGKPIDRVRIFSLHGVKVYDEKLFSKPLKLDGLKAGCYLMDAETRDGLHLYRKIVKN